MTPAKEESDVSVLESHDVVESTLHHREKQSFLNSFSMAASKKQLNSYNVSESTEFEPVTTEMVVSSGSNSRLAYQPPIKIPKIVSEPNFEADLE